jgi:hypothetical protein
MIAIAFLLMPVAVLRREVSSSVAAIDEAAETVVSSKEGLYWRWRVGLAVIGRR